MMIEINNTVGSIDIPTTLTSSEGMNISVGQATTITYQGVSPKIMIDGTDMSEIILRLNDTVLDSARTCSRVRGAYFDSTYAFVPLEPGEYTFVMKGGYRGEPWNELEDIAYLTVVVS